MSQVVIGHCRYVGNVENHQLLCVDMHGSLERSRQDCESGRYRCVPRLPRTLHLDPHVVLFSGTIPAFYTCSLLLRQPVHEAFKDWSIWLQKTHVIAQRFVYCSTWKENKNSNLWGVLKYGGCSVYVKLWKVFACAIGGPSCSIVFLEKMYDAMNLCPVMKKGSVLFWYFWTVGWVYVDDDCTEFLQKPNVQNSPKRSQRTNLNHKDEVCLDLRPQFVRRTYTPTSPEKFLDYANMQPSVQKCWIKAYLFSSLMERNSENQPCL